MFVPYNHSCNSVVPLSPSMGLTIRPAYLARFPYCTVGEYSCTRRGAGSSHLLVKIRFTLRCASAINHFNSSALISPVTPLVNSLSDLSCRFSAVEFFYTAIRYVSDDDLIISIRIHCKDKVYPAILECFRSLGLF